MHVYIYNRVTASRDMLSGFDQYLNNSCKAALLCGISDCMVTDIDSKVDVHIYLFFGGKGGSWNNQSVNSMSSLQTQH